MVTKKTPTPQADDDTEAEVVAPFSEANRPPGASGYLYPSAGARQDALNQATGLFVAESTPIDPPPEPEPDPEATKAKAK
jgi:hypothetical protein